MTRWKCPIPLRLVPDPDSMGFLAHATGTTGLPIGDAHPGAFGFERANHIHEGVDLYCPHGTPVHAVEDGTVVAVIDFTGPSAVPPSPWWHDTQAILVEGASGVVVYGEVGIGTGIREGTRVGAGEPIAHVRQVLTKDKGRPMSMLHLELHVHGTRDAFEWTREGGRPDSLLDPTPLLLEAVEYEDGRNEPVRTANLIERRAFSVAHGHITDAVRAVLDMGLDEDALLVFNDLIITIEPGDDETSVGMKFTKAVEARNRNPD